MSLKQGLLLHRLIARRVPVVVSNLHVSIAASTVISATGPQMTIGMRVDAPFDSSDLTRLNNVQLGIVVHMLVNGGANVIEESGVFKVAANDSALRIAVQAIIDEIPGIYDMRDYAMIDSDLTSFVDCRSSLHSALLFADWQRARLLVGAGVDVNACGSQKHHKSPLGCALSFEGATGGGVEFARSLLQVGVVPQSRDLHCAAAYGQVDILDFMLQTFDIDRIEGSLLHTAAFQSRLTAVAAMLDRASVLDRNADALDAVLYFRFEHDVAIARTLLSSPFYRAAVNNKTLLPIAATHKNIAVFRLFLEVASDVDMVGRSDYHAAGYTALHVAVALNKYDFVDELIDAGANVNKTTTEGNGNGRVHSPLSLLVSSDLPRALSGGFELSKEDRHYRLVQRLLEEGASVDLCYSLHWAVTRPESWPVVPLLLRGADVNLRDNAGNTPLLYFLIKDLYSEAPNDRAVLFALLRDGADPNACAADGMSVLECAILHGIDLYAVRVLLQLATVDWQRMLVLARTGGWQVQPMVWTILVCASANGVELDEPQRVALEQRAADVATERRLLKGALDSLWRPLLFEICVGLQSLEISTEELLAIVDASSACAVQVPRHKKWNIIVLIRHFHERRPRPH